MKIFTRIAVATTALALVAGPAAAQKPQTTPNKDDNPGTSHKLAAPGAYCKQAGASKDKVEGQKRTPFAECVVGQAKVRKGASPKAACKDASKKHVKGQKKTSYSTCVSAAKKYVADKQAQS